MARRRLDSEMVRRGIASGPEEAARAIEAGRVLVSGVIAEKASRLVGAGEPIELAGPPPKYVSRGGLKLEAALDRFGIRCEGRVCLDAGASTGGFADCLLQRGAGRIYAVDVGYGQLHERVSADERVVVMDRTNARYLSPRDLAEPPGLVVADLSFIGLPQVAPALIEVAEPGSDFVFLVKPQFELEPRRVGRGGVVRDPAAWREALETVTDELARLGLRLTRMIPSPLKGQAGNVEFLGWWRVEPANEPGDGCGGRIAMNPDAVVGEDEVPPVAAAIAAAIEEAVAAHGPGERRSSPAEEESGR